MKTKPDEVIEFISTFEMYEKEESGKKPNTVRIITFAKEQKLKEATHIRIRKGYTKHFFIRKITDKTKWRNDWIISWNPNEQAIKKLEQEKDKEIKELKEQQIQLLNNLIIRDKELKELREKCQK